MFFETFDPLFVKLICGIGIFMAAFITILVLAACRVAGMCDQREGRE